MNFLLHIIATTAMSAPNILGFNMLFGRGKIFHFGPLGVSLVASYVTFLTVMATGSYALGIALGLFSTLVVSAFFAWLSLRLDPDGFGVMSIAVHLGLLAVVLNWSSVTRGALGIPRIPRFFFLDSTFDFAVLSLCIALLWGAVLWKLDRSAFGRKLIALSEHDWHAKSLGIDRARTHTAAFLIAGIGALLSVLQYHQYLFLVHPSDFGFPAFIFFVTVVVAGGPGSVRGCIVSLVLLSLLREGLRFIPLAADVLGPLRLILFGLILFVAVWYRRDSLFPRQRTV
jgi:branched-chain amino acid transport system permease protein